MQGATSTWPYDAANSGEPSERLPKIRRLGSHMSQVQNYTTLSYWQGLKLSIAL